MPAYRSAAEAEIRGAVVEHLRQIRPNARIIHEINAGSYGNRIDVLAVDVAEIIAVEIKSAKDKLDRLKDQIAAMQNVAHIAVAALHEKFLRRDNPNHPDWAWPPKDAEKAITWVYPRSPRGGHFECGETWVSFGWHRSKQNLPPGSLMMLWRAELHAICARHAIAGGKGATMERAADLIRWNMTGSQITHEICATLRARKCIEADPEIERSETV
jgi:hypothetical protein